MQNYYDIQNKLFQDEQTRKKLLEELEARSPGSLPEDANTRLSTTGIPPANPNYEVNVSNTTKPMAGQMPPVDDYAKATPEEMAVMQPKSKWTLKKGETVVPPVEPVAAAPKPTSVAEDKEAAALLSTGNDSARRDAELVALEKRRLPNKLVSFGAGVGDAISAAASSFGGNAPGGFQKRVMERQDKDMADDKANIEVKLRNDPNSDISKQYQNLVAQFLQKDPSDPTVLGLTANQIAEKIPQIEKLATLRQQEELKRAEMANERALKAQAASAKSSEDAEKQQLAATAEKQQANVIRQTIKDINDKKLIGWDTTGPGGMKIFAPIDKPNLEAKLNTIKANIAFDKLNKLRQASPTGGAVGQVSDKDMELLQSVLGSLSTDQSPEELRNSLKTIDEIFTKFQGYGEPSQTSSNAAPQGDKQTKSGYTFRPVKRNG